LNFPRTPEMVVYTDRNLTKADVPVRYAVRYFRGGAGTTLRTLEENLPNRRGAKRAWAVDAVHRERAARNAEAAKAIGDEPTAWTFDDSVAADFDRIAQTSIPHYQEVLEKTVEIIAKRGYADPKIIDVGSAVGGMLKRLYDAGFRNLYGVDSSPAMLARSFAQAVLIQSPNFPVEQGPFDVVIANWVLHFIKDRRAYLEDIRSGLAENGMLVLTEKVQSSSLTHDLYHDFKRSQGLSDAEIEAKQERLKGVLVSYPLEWYLTTLRELGFAHIDVVDAHYSFVTILATRN